MTTVEEIINKLHKLKDDASQAPDFLALEKVSTKVEKIRAKLDNFKKNKELGVIIDKIDLLIKEKNKYFRHRMIKNSSKLDNEENEEAERTLKYSKSAENLTTGQFKKLQNTLGTDNNYKTISGSKKGFENPSHESTTYQKEKASYANHNRRENSDLADTSTLTQSKTNWKRSERNHQENNSLKSIRNYDGEESVEKTTINGKTPPKGDKHEKQRLENEICFLNEKLSFSFKQIEEMTKKIDAMETNSKNEEKERVGSPMAKNFFLKQESIVDEYNHKIREKSYKLESTKAQLDYYKALSEELKNRIINEQRKSEDYIEDLKTEIKSCKKQLEKYKKENEILTNEIEDYNNKNDSLINEIKKLVSRLEDEIKQKNKIEKDLTQTITTQKTEFQKEITQLKSENESIKKYEIKLEEITSQKEEEIKYIEILKNKIKELEEESNKYHHERNQLELQLFNINEQNLEFKELIKVNISAKEMLAEELLDTKEKLEEQFRMTNLLEYENDLKTKNKLTKLKEIKGLLTELK